MLHNSANEARTVGIRIALVLWALTCVLLAASLAGQGPADDEIRILRRPYFPRATPGLRVQAELVEVRVVVRDRERKPVAGLGQEDFQILDAGKPQAISTFIVDQRPAPAPTPADAQPALPSSGGAETTPVQPLESQPRYIAFFFDDWNMPLGDLGPARTAVEKFVQEGMRPGDQVGVFTSSSRITLDFTNDAEKLYATIARILPNERNEKGEDFCPRISTYQAYRISSSRARDALALAIEEGVQEGCLRGMSRPMAEGTVQTKADRLWLKAEQAAQETLASIGGIAQRMSRLKGNRVLLLASSGFFSLTPEVQRQQDRLIENALRNGVVINSLDAKGLVAEWLGGPPSNPRPYRLTMRSNLANVARSIENRERDAINDPLSAVARETGGRFFTNNNDLVTGVRELAVAPEISYVLGFTPQNLKPDGRFHKLEVKLAGRDAGGLNVVARRGYYAPDKAEQEQAAIADKLESTVLAKDNVTEIPCEVGVTTERVAVAGSASQQPLLRVVIRVDARKLPFQKRGDRSVERLRVVTALFDAQENFVTGSEAQVDLSLKPDTLEHIKKDGLEGEMELRVPPGTYRLRQVVQEAVEGRMAAITRPVEVRP